MEHFAQQNVELLTAHFVEQIIMANIIVAKKLNAIILLIGGTDLSITIHVMIDK